MLFVHISSRMSLCKVMLLLDYCSDWKAYVPLYSIHTAYISWLFGFMFAKFQDDYFVPVLNENFIFELKICFWPVRKTKNEGGGAFIRTPYLVRLIFEDYGPSVVFVGILSPLPFMRSLLVIFCNRLCFGLHVVDF